MLNNNQVVAIKGKIKGHSLLEHFFGFCKSFKKITKILGFHSTFGTANLQDNILTLIADNINVTNNSLYLYVPFLLPSTDTQLMFNVSIQNNYKLPYDEWYSERRLVTDSLFQVDIGSAQQVNSPKFVICSHQTAIRLNAPSRNINFSIFEHLDVIEYFAEIDGYRYPRGSVVTNYDLNDYIHQYRDLNFFKEYVGEELLNPFISYTDMKNKYPIQVIDLKFQVDQITAKKIELFEEFRNNPYNARLFVIIIRRREIEIISDGNKLIEVKII